MISKLLTSNNIFSSTIIDDQMETDSFSLKLSESCINDTEEFSRSQFIENHLNEMVISDSSCNESIFSSNNLNKFQSIERVSPKTKDIILETSSDESYISSAQDVFAKIKNSISRKFNEKDNPKKLFIERKNYEFERTKNSEFVIKSQSENVILSKKKKDEIIKWLSNNFNSTNTNLYSQDSIISNTKKSNKTSGDSSLEYLELNIETPNNRGKLSKTDKINKKICQSNKVSISDVDSKNNKLLVKLDHKDFEIPRIRRCINTPMHDSKFYLKKINTLTLMNSNTNISLNKSDKETLINEIKNNCENVITADSQFIDYKTVKTNVNNTSIICTSANSNKLETGHLNEILTKNIKIKPRKMVIPESESNDSTTSETNQSSKIPVSILQTNVKKILQKRRSFDSENDSYIVTKSNIKTNSRNIELSKVETLESGIWNIDYHSQTAINNSLSKIPVSADLKHNSEAVSDSIDLNIKCRLNNEDNLYPTNNKFNSTIDEYADILENLYGKNWRDKASILISSTKPKINKKKVFESVKIKENLTFKQPLFYYKSNNYLLDKDNFLENKLKNSEIFKKLKNSLINDDSVVENSLNHSFYSAITNSIVSQDNQLKIPSIEDNSKNKKKLSTSNSVFDLNKKNWRSRNNQRKLSFNSTSSNTSEYDPEDIILPKLIAKRNNINNVINSVSLKSKITKSAEQDIKETFLASLSKNVPLQNADFKAIIYKTKYNIMKEELCKDLFKLFNDQIFNNQLPHDLLIEWSARLRGTAGKCYNKQSQTALKNSIRSSRIVLSKKILDSPDRLRDTLIHEMCHAATWLINNVSDGHGTFWKAWANKATEIFPELPPISRCHTYEILTKYTYKCIDCGYSIGRHSKSLNLNKKRCGYCHGKFELLMNKITKTGKVQKKSTYKTKELSGFALYVKENYQLVKQSKVTIKHGEVMKILSKQFSAIKISQN